MAGLLTVLNPGLVSSTRMLLGETLFSFLLVGTALILFPLIESGRQRAVLWIFPGLVLGLATLCRPVAGLWVLFIGTAVMLRSGVPPLKRLVRVLLMFAGVALVVTPWLVRNAAVMGAPVMATSGGRTFWTFGHNDAGEADETTVRSEEFLRAIAEARPRELAERGGDPARMVPIFNLEPAFHAGFYEQRVVDRLGGLGEVEADAEYWKMGMEFVRAHPVRALVGSLKNVLEVFAFTEMDGTVNLVLLWVMPFLLLGMYRLWKESGTAGIIVMTCLLSLAVVFFIFLPERRYRVPYQPFFMLAGAAGVISVARGRMTVKERVLLFGWWVVPVTVNYWMLWGKQMS